MNTKQKTPQQLRNEARFCASARDRAELEQQASRLETGQEHPAITTANCPLKIAGLEEKPDLCTGGTKLVGPCPACREQGRDSQGKHLVVYPNNKWGCVAFPSTEIETPARNAHMRRIWALAGGNLSSLAEPARMDPAVKARRAKLVADARMIWERSRVQYAMSVADWQKTSAELPTSPVEHYRAWCSIWRAGEPAWCGDRYDCEADFVRHLFKPASEFEKGWGMCKADGCDHTSGWVWKSDATGRAASNRTAQRVFVPVEHDEVPEHEQVALTRYLEAELGLNLLMAVHTTNRGFHSLFDARELSQAMIAKLEFFLAAIGADYGTFRRGSSRTPGATRQNHFDGKPFGSVQPIIYIKP
jgi:hypothetical protein